MIPQPTFDDSSHRVTLEIDLNEVLGGSVDDATALSAGTEIVDRIVEFARNGRNAAGKSFKHYDEDYVESEEFQAAGKSKSNVNMTLYGDMLAQLNVIEVNSGRITLGWEDETQAKKAYAHMTGFKGHPTIKNGTKREFLGVSQKLLDEIKDQFSVEDRDTNESASVALSLLESLRQGQQSENDERLYDFLFGGLTNDEN
ncbi:MAG: hypothetical protein CME63_01520 [Halobacteriovoraceae bacterium]|nr:hypothetical protein [Halobacteriovoraceae bacterium]|tara:strand:+ start:29847 stop:30446 length:600 start_codon:yes stop_codon:yes gene_type:complete